VTRKLLAATAALAVAAGLSVQPAWSQPTAVTAGTLNCNVSSGWGFVFGSTRDLKCTFTDSGGVTQHYTGHIDKFGADIGYQVGGVVVWAVLAPTAKLEKGTLAGSYVGATVSAAVGVGAGANLLVGGSDKTITLQPLSVEGMKGLNVAAGVAAIILNQAPD